MRCVLIGLIDLIYLIDSIDLIDLLPPHYSSHFQSTPCILKKNTQEEAAADAKRQKCRTAYLVVYRGAVYRGAH